MTVQNGSLAPSQKQEKPWVETPLKESSSLSKAAKWYELSCHAKFKPSNNLLNRRSRVFLKLENLQPSGSFMSRYTHINYSLLQLSRKNLTVITRA